MSNPEAPQNPATNPNPSSAKGNPNPAVVAQPQPQANPSTDVQALIERARREEKEKLYGEIEAKGTEIKKMNEEKAKLEERLSLETTSKSAEYGKMTDEIARLTALVEATRNEAKLKEEQAIEQARVAELEAFKQKRISEVGASNLIVDLVSGNTEEEIEKAILKSQERMASIKTQAEEEAKKSLAKNTHTPPVTNPGSGGANPATPATPADGLPVELTAEAISKMTPEEFKKHRDTLKKEASSSVQEFYKGRPFGK